MGEYRRGYVPGGTVFLTLVTNYRRPILVTDLARPILQAALIETRRRRPFGIDAIVLLPDHLHMVWTLPDDDPDLSRRVSQLKARFTHSYLAAGGLEGGRSRSRVAKRERGVWHRRFWEHVVRDVADLERICDYVHYNPVKHGHASCPHAWAYSSFGRFVGEGFYGAAWNCACAGQGRREMDFDHVAKFAGE